jgi:ketosteroid isomerase-like protein
MSRENEETVRRTYALWAARDLDGILALMDPDVEIRSLLTEAERTSYRGHRGVAEWYGALLGVFPNWDPQIERMQSVGEAVVIKVRVKASAAGSGAPVDESTWQVVRFRDGKVVFVGWFRTEVEALEAAGLRE